MKLTTKQTVAGCFSVWMLSMAGGVVTYAKLQENHDVRITTLEKVTKAYAPTKGSIRRLEAKVGQLDVFVEDTKTWMNRLSADQVRGREESIRVVEALKYVAETQKSVVEVTKSLQLTVVRLEAIYSITSTTP